MGWQGINAILGVDHIFQSLGDGLAEDDTSLINAVTVCFVDHPVHERAEKVPLAELEDFFRIISIYLFYRFIDGLHDDTSIFFKVFF